MNKKRKILFWSNGSSLKTGFGANVRNILKTLHKDPDLEVYEASNGFPLNKEIKTPWKSFGTYPVDQGVLNEINGDEGKKRLAYYGNYAIDKIIEEVKPDVIFGIEDIWAFDIAKKKWHGNVPFVAWITVDSLPILEQAKILHSKSDKFLVWATFAEEQMKKDGYDVETLHGAIDYSSFFPLSPETKKNLRQNVGIQDSDFVIGFVFKNQLRKSVPNLLDGFKRFKEKCPKNINPKLLLHTEWERDGNCWDIESYIKEKGIDKKDVLTTYICDKCNRYHILPYQGSGLDCPFCSSQKSFGPKRGMVSVSEKQLNEIYNVMDVYCHPFTSGGQELPIQEAKAAGLITLVTEYSCGTDSCYPEQGGLPLSWHEYREPFTNFIKATTDPESICKNLLTVLNMSETEKQQMIENAITHVNNNFSIEKICQRIKEIAFEFPECKWDFDFTEKQTNPDYVPDNSIEVDEEWLIDAFYGIFGKKFKKTEYDIIENTKLIKKDGRDSVLEYLKQHAIKLNLDLKLKQTSLADILGEEDKDRRIAIIIPESAGDVLMINGLMEGLKNLYPDDNIYVFTKPEFFCMIDDNPFVHRVLPFRNGLDNLLYLEGIGNHEGFFRMAFLPHVGSQKYLNYLHNGQDINAFNI
jgi:hypothetical protein